MVRVLVVDDELLVASALRRLLRREGFQVEIALSGEEALGMLPAFEADLVISDFRMKGMSGTELLEQVHHLMPRVRRVLVSGCVDPYSGEAHRQAGLISLFVSKPWDDRALVSQLRALVGAEPAPGTSNA